MIWWFAERHLPSRVIRNGFYTPPVIPRMICWIADYASPIMTMAMYQRLHWETYERAVEDHIGDLRCRSYLLVFLGLLRSRTFTDSKDLSLVHTRVHQQCLFWA